jgi:hypothetical protein
MSNAIVKILAGHPKHGSHMQCIHPPSIIPKRLKSHHDILFTYRLAELAMEPGQTLALEAAR